jgi:beta-lactamase class D
MMRYCGLPSGLVAAGLTLLPAQARVLCTTFADAHTAQILEEHGSCDAAVTPASTFKIAISLMGFDARILENEHAPAWPFREGYLDWRPEWRQTTDPASWIKYSVVWYSQQVTQKLGPVRFQDYVRALHYGNEDVSGDPGKHNGLTRAWLSSSLKISPHEQLAFLEKLLNRQLPVSSHAIDMTRAITRIDPSDGWEIHGKTGTGAPIGADGTRDEAHSYGWFVGWARKGAAIIVFARLIQDEGQESDKNEPAGLRARATFLAELPASLKKFAP